jgi:phosphoribosylaminoimidazolecarboxamide formyltransferase/IMP cyclohydrolase
VVVTTVRVERALISVHDKAGVVPFAQRLHAAGVEIVSSGGTAAALAAAGVPVILVADVTGAAEMLGGRVKTLHPSIHGGILARPTDPSHRRDLEDHSIRPFQLVVVNLYPFEQTLADPTAPREQLIEEIDIGGVALIRAAAKNHEFVGVATSPEQYELVAAEIEQGGLTASTRLELARAAFFRTTSYDAAIANWLEAGRGEDLPLRTVQAYTRQALLRYGENPHQAAGLYQSTGTAGGWATARLIQGKEMSFNNYLDAEAAWRLVSVLGDRPAAVIVKHTNPCGVAFGDDAADALSRAWECDPLSAFGGVIALNDALDEAAAGFLSDRFVEVVIAPRVEAELSQKPTLRVITAPPLTGVELDARPIAGGIMLQQWDLVEREGWDVLTTSQPTPQQSSDLKLAWTVAAHTKSNSVVVVKDGMAIGVGAGDQSRLGAAERALVRAGDRSQQAVAASDAFFPFPDALERLIEAGVVAVVAPGGSRRDSEVLETAESAGIVFVRAARRHFRH